MFFRLCATSLLLLIVACFCGCESPRGVDRDEQKNPHFLEGKERAKARDYKGAIEAFQHAVESNPNSALAHFELGMLYEKHDDQNEWRHVLALYHYYRAYELRPNAYPADNAKVRIQACRQELAKAESLAPLYPSMQRELEKLREENSQLHRQLEFLQAQALANTAALTTNPVPATPAGRVTRSDPAGITTSSHTLPSSLSSSGNSDKVVDEVITARKHLVRDRETMASIARIYSVSV